MINKKGIITPSGFHLISEDFNFTRDSFDNLADLKEYTTLYKVPNGFMTYVKSEKCRYEFHSDNTETTESGKWRKLDYEALIAQLQSTITNLQDKVNSNETNINSLNNNVSNNTNSINKLNSDNDVNKQDILDLKTNVTNNSLNIVDVKTSVSSNTESILNLTQTAITINNEIGGLKTSATTNSDKINNLIVSATTNSNDIKNLSDRVTQLETRPVSNFVDNDNNFIAVINSIVNGEPTYDLLNVVDENNN